MKALLHRFAHLLRLNYGTVEAWHEGEVLMVGYRCDGCGKMMYSHRADIRIPR